MADREHGKGTAAARVTVVVPCYNDGGLVREAIESIQESEPVDVIVVDDGSRDSDTLRVLETLAADGTCVLHHERNRGPGRARNTGLENARSEYVFPLDADDLAVPGALSAMADLLDANPTAAVCFGDYLEFGRHNLVRAVPPRLDAYRLAFVNEYPVASLFRRSVLLEIGGWRWNGPPGYEDWDLWLTLIEKGHTGVHLGAGALTYRRRLHGERLLTIAKRDHRAMYRQIRSNHPEVFGEIRRHRQASDLSLQRKVLYPLVYGSRRRFSFEPRVKRLLDRIGVWTLRR